MGQYIMMFGKSIFYVGRGTIPQGKSLVCRFTAVSILGMTSIVPTVDNLLTESFQPTK